MLVNKGFKIDEEIVRCIEEDAAKDTGSPNNISAVVRKILHEYYKDRLEANGGVTESPAPVEKVSPEPLSR